MNLFRFGPILWSVFALGCSGSASSETPGRAAPVSTQSAAAPSSLAPTAEPPATPFVGSIYDLASTLTDQDGQRVSLDLFRGHPVLITMFFARCPNACPILTTNLKRIDAKLPPGVREKVRIVMVSFDAEHDTPPALAKYAHERNLDLSRWKLTNAPEDTAREIAAALNIRYRKLDNGMFFHSSAIVLLDESGRLTARVDGLEADPAPILAALR
jgi:protein SCO1/2